MKKTLATVALASLGAGSLFAQNGIPGLSINGQVGYESENVFRGKEHSDSNIEATIKGRYDIPSFSLPATIYGGVKSMSPISEQANQVDWNLGAAVKYEQLSFDAGWIFYTYPNNEAAPNPSAWNTVTNRGIYNRSNEVYVGVSTDLEWASPGVYVFYDFNLEQVTYEAYIKRTIEGHELGIPDLALDLKAYAGYVSASQYNGDQRHGASKWSNDYGYLGVSADLVFHLTPTSDVGVGVRYAWNNDNSDFDIPGNTDDNLWWGAWVRFKY